ncbi:MAG: hypothetical protein Kow0069_31910 [Promethearchaeota archaeon]
MSVRLLGDHAIVTTYCRICEQDVKIRVDKSRIEGAPRYPCEFTYIHESPGGNVHAILLYLDAQFQVRGSEIIRNVQIEKAGGDHPRVIAEVLTKIPAMAVSLGMISQREYDVLAECDGKRDAAAIAKRLGSTREDVEEVLSRLESRKLVKLRNERNA